MTKLRIYLIVSALSLLLVSCSNRDNTESASNKSQTSESSKNTDTKKPYTQPDTSGLSKATFAAGCFWCEEVVFESVIGVEEVISGYAGGNTKNPTYEEVGTGTTGHTETFQVYYDMSRINYQTLLKVFFASQDPTQVNGQGPDIGSQYRSAIFYHNDTEKQLAEKFISDLNQSGKFNKPIAAEVIKFTEFWPAEKYHQDYIMKNPGDSYVRNESIPRLKRTQKQIPDLIKPDKSVLDN